MEVQAAAARRLPALLFQAWFAKPIRLVPTLLVASLFFSMPLMSMFGPAPDVATRRAFWPHVMSSLTFGDVLLCAAGLDLVRRRKRWLSQWRSPGVLLVAALVGWCLIAAGIQALQGPASAATTYQVLRLLLVASMLVLVASLEDFTVSSSTMAWALTALLVLSGFVAIATGSPLFQHLPSYAGYMNPLVNRFVGMSDNTNALAGPMFVSAAMLALLPRRQSPKAASVALVIILAVLAGLMKGRHALLIVVLMALVWLDRTPLAVRARHGLAVALLTATFGALLLSVTFALFPLRKDPPFISTAPSLYDVAHRAYVKLSAAGPVVGRSQSELETAYPQAVDRAAIASAVRVRGLADATVTADMIISRARFQSPQSIALDIWSRFGTPALVLFGASLIWLIAGYARVFGAGLPTQIVVLSMFPVIFGDLSRANWLLLFVEVAYLSALRMRPSPASPKAPALA
jgi:hypothetical protein